MLQGDDQASLSTVVKSPCFLHKALALFKRDKDDYSCQMSAKLFAAHRWICFFFWCHFSIHSNLRLLVLRVSVPLTLFGIQFFFHVFSQSVGIREFAEGICSKYAGAQTSEPNVFRILSVTSLEGLSSPSPFFAAPFLSWELTVRKSFSHFLRDYLLMLDAFDLGIGYQNCGSGIVIFPLDLFFVPSIVIINH